MDQPAETVTLSDASMAAMLTGEDLGLCLTVVHHADSALLGHRVPLKAKASYTLGRDATCFGDTALGDPAMSRSHARIEVSRGGKATVTDLESRNGSWIGEEQVQERALVEGEILRLGASLFLCHRSTPSRPELLPPPLLGMSFGMQMVHQQITQIGPHDTTVLILGETGTGKELVARALHDASGRGGPMNAINCAGLSDTLLQSELFGHVRGAFSGATGDRPGLFEASRGGTLLLDEVGDAPATVQVSLLRVLQEKVVRRVGANRAIPVDTRVVSATHRELHAHITEGSFREDLFGRLAGWILRLPPLRHRREDIPLLLRHFLDEKVDSVRPVHHKLAYRLLTYDWPRNVRELQSVAERVLLTAGDGPTYKLNPDVAALLVNQPTDAADDTAPVPPREATHPSQFRDTDALKALLVEHGGNVRKVADAAGVSRNTLYRWFRDLNVDPTDYRESEEPE
jgi:DNA-binding NtrC family response regulator